MRVRITCMDFKDVEKIPIRQLLLSPMYLLHHFSATLVPGVLAVFLLMMKHSALVPEALSVTGMLGYKTRIVLGLLIAFVIGRIIQAGVLLILKFVHWIAGKAKTALANEEPNVSDASGKTESEKTADNSASGGEPKECTESAEQTPPEILAPEVKSEEKSAKLAKDGPKLSGKLTPEQETNRHFFSALLLGTVLEKDGSAFDKWDSQRAQLGLALTSGCVLLVASFYRGDGLRAYEFWGGLTLALSGLVQGRDLNRIRIEALGSALGQFIAAHSVEENREILSAVAPVLPIVMKHINPTTVEKQPAQIVAEIAEKSKSKIAPHLNWQQQQHKKKKKR